MTCIVAVKEQSRIVMGADSAGVAGLRVQSRSDPKIYRVKYEKQHTGCRDALIGFTTSFRMGQLLGYSLSLPEIKKGENLEKYMVTKFIDGVRSCLKDGGYASKKEEKELGGTFLVVIENELFEIHDDYQVGKRHHDYSAVGCGDELALGSLYTTSDWKNAKDRAEVALEAAACFSAGVSAPFIFDEVSIDSSPY